MTRSADLDEVLGPEVGMRLARELGAALRRRTATELALAGVLRVLVGTCVRLRESACAAFELLVRRRSIDRPLYVALLRALVEAHERRVVEPLSRVLASGDGGGLATIAAAALSDDLELARPLSLLAGAKSAQIAFAADVARVARGESDGALALAMAPRIKESHRTELANELLLPLLRCRRSVTKAVPAVGILRDSERHLGRWLCLALLEQLSGDDTAIERSRANVRDCAPAARSAWTFVLWALLPEASCTSRPTLDVMARLSDRPSAERDLTFLFRMGEARVRSARAMLEGLVKASELDTSAAVRAAALLIRNFGRADLQARLLDVVRSSKHESLRGLALAAVADSRGDTSKVSPHDLLRSRHHATLGFAALVGLASHGHGSAPVLTENNYRRLQLGWVD